jgi:hypothetical protein
MRRILCSLLIAIVLIVSLAEVLEVESDSGGFMDQPESPLFHAAKIGHLNNIIAGLEEGHDVNVRNSDGWTPLLFAVDAYQPQVIMEVLN